MASKMIKYIIKSKTSSNSDDFTGDFHQILKEEIIPALQTHSGNKGEGNTCTLYEASIILIQKPKEDITSIESY